MSNNFTWYGESGYSYPDKSQVNFTWGGMVIQEPEISGSLSFNVFTLSSEIFVVPSISSTNIFNDFTIQSVITFDNSYSVTGIGTFNDFTLNGYVDVISPSDFYVYGDLSFNDFTSTSIISVGNLVRFNNRYSEFVISSSIILPNLVDFNQSFNDFTIQSQIVSESVIFGDLKFDNVIVETDSIVISGYPEAPLIRQAFEFSTNRTLQFTESPEDPVYPIFIPTTDINVNAEDIRRGTVNFKFEFDHDAKEIIKISVWVLHEDGNAYKDKFNVIDYPDGQYKEHVLNNPFVNTSVLQIPIHCISAKSNQFFIEIEYKNTSEFNLSTSNRTIRPTEKYYIPFQAHFDNRNPYANTTDSIFLNGPSSSVNAMFETSSEMFGQTFSDKYENIASGVSQNATENTWSSEEYVLLTQIFLDVQYDYVYNVSQNATENISFIKEYVDLSQGQIGG